VFNRVYSLHLGWKHLVAFARLDHNLLWFLRPGLISKVGLGRTHLGLSRRSVTKADRAVLPQRLHGDQPNPRLMTGFQALVKRVSLHKKWRVFDHDRVQKSTLGGGGQILRALGVVAGKTHMAALARAFQLRHNLF